MSIFDFKKIKKVPQVNVSDHIIGDTYIQECQRAQDILGVSCGKPASSNEAIILVGKEKPLVKRSIAYHKINLTNGGKKLVIDDVFRHTPEASILIRLLSQPNRGFLKHIEDEKRLSENKYRVESLRLVYDWAYPRDDGGVYGNDMFIWAPTVYVIPTSVKQTASLEGHIVRQGELGQVLKSVVYGDNSFYDYSSIQRKDDKDSCVGQNPIWYACPQEITFKDNHFIFPKENIAGAFWRGLVTKNNIDVLLTLGDLLLSCEIVNGELWVSAVLRAMTYIDNPEDTPDFYPYQKVLHRLGRWDRMSYDMVQKCFKAFVPGSSPLSNGFKQSLGKEGEKGKDREKIFSSVSNHISMVGDHSGRTMLGLMNNQKPLIIESLISPDDSTKPGFLFVGKTKSGKSTYACALADHTTKNVILIPCTREEFKSDWVVKNGGRSIPFNLPDADVVLNKEGEYNPDYQTVRKKQEELHLKDQQLVSKYIDDIVQEWDSREKIVGMPITFDIGQEAGITRYFNFVSLFIKEWSRIWANRHRATRERCLIVVDNYTAIPALMSYRDSGPLGSIPKGVSRYLSTQIKTLVSTGTNFGCGCWVLTSSPGDLSIVGEDFIDQFNMRFYVDSNSRGYNAYVFSGPYSDIEEQLSLNLGSGVDFGNSDFKIPSSLLSVINVRLPGALRERYERREFKEFGREPWTERIPPEVTRADV